MDGAFVIGADCTVLAAAQYVDASAEGLTMTKGLGSRHWAAAAISRKTNAVAVTVSQSSGTVRVFQNGEVMLRIEPFRDAHEVERFRIRTTQCRLVVSHRPLSPHFWAALPHRARLWVKWYCEERLR